jgi:hypothetical protein
MFTRFSRLTSSMSRSASCTCEPLERRMLFAIDWINKGSGPADDTDSFDAVYGANATIARD